jgi:hypothetical protein
MLNILYVNLPANHMEDNLLINIYTQDNHICRTMCGGRDQRSGAMDVSISIKMLLLTLL